LTLAEIRSRHGVNAFVEAGLGEDFRPGGGESVGEVHARVAAFLKDVAREDSDAIAVAHLGVLRAAYTLATGWDMATPMPAELDVSKILMLKLGKDGAPKVEQLNMEFVAG
jgi:probable phosphoglycerate mutase